MFYVFIKFVFVSIAITDWKVSISYVLTFIYCSSSSYWGKFGQGKLH